MNKLFESVDNLFSSDSSLILDAEKERKDRVAKLRESVKARNLKSKALKESEDNLHSDEISNLVFNHFDAELAASEDTGDEELPAIKLSYDIGGFDSNRTEDEENEYVKVIEAFYKDLSELCKSVGLDVTAKYMMDDPSMPDLLIIEVLEGGDIIDLSISGQYVEKVSEYSKLVESKDEKSLKEHSFDTDSDPVEVLRAIHEQYMDLGMNDEFYSDVLNRSDLGIEDLISWFEMGESDKSTKPEKKDVLKESSEMCVAMECSRTGYGPDQVVDDSMTVNELIDVLNGFDGDMKIVTSHDGGYTYGPISYGDFEEINVSDDEESEDEDYNESEKVSHRVKENEETKLFNKVARICESRKVTNNVVKESNANILKRAGKKPVNKKSL